METSKAKKVSYVIAGTLILLFLGLLYAWSIFRAPLSAVHTDWTPSQLSLIFTVSMICFCLGGFIAGKLMKFLKNQFIVLLAAAMLFVGFFVISRMEGADSASMFAVMIVCYGILCGLGVGFGYNAVISAVTKWFPGKQGLISGILLMGFGFGALILGSIVNSLIASSGIFNTFFYLALVIVAVLAVGSFFIKMPKAVPNAQSAVQGKNYTSAQMLKTSSFWCFFIWSVLLNSAGLLVINSAADIALAFSAPAVLGLIVSVLNGGGRVLFGTMYDHLGRAKTMTTNAFTVIIAGVCLFLGAATQNFVPILIGLLFTGVSYGGSPTASSFVINNFYGPKNYPVNFSISNFSLIPAALIGPMIASSLQESAAGAYDTTFIMMTVLAVCVLVMSFVVTARAKKDSLEA